MERKKKSPKIYIVTLIFLFSAAEAYYPSPDRFKPGGGSVSFPWAPDQTGADCIPRAVPRVRGSAAAAAAAAPGVAGEVSLAARQTERDGRQNQVSAGFFTVVVAVVGGGGGECCWCRVSVVSFRCLVLVLDQREKSGVSV